METAEQSGRGTGMSSRGSGAQEASTSARPFVGASVNYIGTSADSLKRAQRYAALVTALNEQETSISLCVFTPTGGLLTLAGIRFSAAPEPGCWTWPAAGGS